MAQDGATCDTTAWHIYRFHDLVWAASITFNNNGRNIVTSCNIMKRFPQVTCGATRVLQVNIAGVLAT